eukprot:m.241079 g.241079  ORF g.241079 m.241079 type:complete len:84 (-) comp17625_c0_seq1:845-1096(-)
MGVSMPPLLTVFIEKQHFLQQVTIKKKEEYVCGGAGHDVRLHCTASDIVPETNNKQHEQHNHQRKKITSTTLSSMRTFKRDVH